MLRYQNRLNNIAPKRKPWKRGFSLFTNQNHYSPEPMIFSSAGLFLLLVLVERMGFCFDPQRILTLSFLLVDRHKPSSTVKTPLFWLLTCDQSRQQTHAATYDTCHTAQQRHQAIHCPTRNRSYGAGIGALWTGIIRRLKLYAVSMF